MSIIGQSLSVVNWKIIFIERKGEDNEIWPKIKDS